MFKTNKQKDELISQLLHHYQGICFRGDAMQPVSQSSRRSVECLRLNTGFANAWAVQPIQSIQILLKRKYSWQDNQSLHSNKPIIQNTNIHALRSHSMFRWSSEFEHLQSCIGIQWHDPGKFRLNSLLSGLSISEKRRSINMSFVPRLFSSQLMWTF